MSTQQFMNQAPLKSWHTGAMLLLLLLLLSSIKTSNRSSRGQKSVISMSITHRQNHRLVKKISEVNAQKLPKMLVSPRLSRNRRADLSPASRLRPASTRLSVQNAVSAFATSVFVIRWNSSCSWSKTILISIHYNQHKYSAILRVNVSPQLTAMEYLSVASCVCAYMWIVINRNWIDVMRNNGKFWFSQACAT